MLETRLCSLAKNSKKFQLPSLSLSKKFPTFISEKMKARYGLIEKSHWPLKKHGHIDGKVNNPVFYHDVFRIQDVGIPNFRREFIAEFI